MPIHDRERAKRGASDKRVVDRICVIASLEREGLLVTEWTDDGGTFYPPHAHPHREVRVVLEGSMTVVVDGRACTLGPGQRIDLAPGQVHEARIGADGVRYLAASDRAGNVGSDR